MNQIYSFSHSFPCSAYFISNGSVYRSVIFKSHLCIIRWLYPPLPAYPSCCNVQVSVCFVICLLIIVRFCLLKYIFSSLTRILSLSGFGIIVAVSVGLACSLICWELCHIFQFFCRFARTCFYIQDIWKISGLLTNTNSERFLTIWWHL